MNADIKKKFDDLKPEWQVFIKEYLIDFNKGKAYSIAYNREIDGTSYTNGHELLKNTNILEIIQAEIKEKLDKLDITANWVLEQLKELVIRCMQKKPVMAYDKAEKKWHETGEWTFDSNGANSALDKLGKYFKLFSDTNRIEIDWKNTKVIFAVPEMDKKDE